MDTKQNTKSKRNKASHKNVDTESIVDDEILHCDPDQTVQKLEFIAVCMWIYGGTYANSMVCSLWIDMCLIYMLMTFGKSCL